MKRYLGLGWLALAIMVASGIGCGGESGTESGSDDSSSSDSGTTDTGTDSAGNVSLSPGNAKIQFVGRHVDKSKDDREGSFEAFTGTLGVDAEANAPTSLSLEIETESITTPIEQLTNHLKGPDFFNAREMPSASFTSSKVEAGEGDGQFIITGDFEMLGNKGEVTFPATVTGSGDTMKLVAEFDIDRTKWGMNYGPDNIEAIVSIKLEIGG